MGFFKKLASVLASASPRPAGDDTGFYFYVRCEACGEKLRVRVDRRWDLQQQFGEKSDRLGGYSLSKEVLGERCFKLMRVSMEFDPAYRETSRSAEGGEFITREEYERTS